MFVFSVVDSVSGAFRFGLSDAVRFDPDSLGSFAIRAIPLDDAEEVKGVSFALRNGNGDVIAEASDLAAPFDFVGQGAAVLGALADGTYTLTATALDGAGQPLDTPTVSSFTLGADDDFAGFRVQAEETGGLDIGADGNVAAIGSTSGAVPIIRRLADQVAGTPDALHTDNADNDAYVDFGGGTAEYLEFTITVPEAGAYDIDFGYALGGNTAANLNRSMELKVNDAIFDRHFSFPTTNPSNTSPNFQNYSESSARVQLVEGTNTIRLTTNGLSGPNVDYLDVRPVDGTHIVIQAESLMAPVDPTVAGTGNRPITEAFTVARNNIAGPGTETFRVGAEGDSYLDWGSAANTVDINVTADVAGTYAMTITYVNGGTTSRPLALSQVTGGTETPLGSFAFAPTVTPAGRTTLTNWEGWTVSQTINVTLAAGANTLRLAGTNGPNLDKIDLVLTSPALTSVEIDHAAVIENVAGAVIGNLSVNGGQDLAVSYATDDSRFVVVNHQLKLADGVSLDFEAAQTATVTVTATNSGGSKASAFTIAVGNDASDDVTVPGDTTADEGGDLALASVAAAVDGDAGLGAVTFRLTGVDADITGFAVSLDAGESFAPATATADGPGAFLLTIDLSGYHGAPEGLAVVRVTDAAGNQASAAASVAITYPEEPSGFPLEIQAESFAVHDTTGTGTAMTQARVPGNVEPNPPAGDADGLWNGFTGAGYMDMGAQVGDAVSFTVDAPTAGIYTLTFRYSNGGGAPNGPRPMALTVDGVAAPTNPQFAGTGVNGWDNWQTETVSVSLQAGSHTIRLANTVANGPNLDKVTIAPDLSADADGNLTLVPTDLSDPAQAVFTVTGVDADVTSLAVRVNGGALQPVVPGAAGKFVLDLGALGAGDAAVELVVTDATGNNATASAIATIPVRAAFSQTVQAETFAVIDTVGTTGLDLTQARVPGNTETVIPERPTGLWDGHTGQGYMDMGQNVGDAVTFTVDAPAPGTYTLSFRYANGSTADRPMAFSIDGGAAQNLTFAPGTAWTDWRTQTVEVTLTAGSHTFKLANTLATAPNIDRVIISSAATDASADEDGNLALAVTDLADPAAAVFTVTGVDADVVSLAVRVNGGDLQTVSPNPSGQFTLDLSALAPGDASVQLVVTDGAGNTAAASATATLGAGEPEPFALTIQGESFSVTDTVGTTDVFLTQARTPSNPETVTPERPTGLWAGHTGAGYMDMGQDVGDKVAFSVTVPAAGTYVLSFRYANGGTADRPMAFSVDGGAPQTLAFVPGTAWTDWRTQTVEVTLTSGTHTFSLANTIATGPNIDQVTIVSAEGDTSADVDGNLALELVSMDDATAALFRVTGADPDITQYAVRINGGVLHAVSPNASGEFTLDLSGLTPGYASVAIIVTDANANEASVTAMFPVEPEGPAPFSVELQAETFTIIDTTGTTSATGLTVVRDPSNPEAPTAEIGPDGLWDNFTGTGYVDMGTNVGDAVAFSVTVPEDGLYTLTFRYAAGGAAARPMTLALDGTTVTTVPFASTTTFANWTDVSVNVNLTAGTRSFTLANAGATGPNLDRVTIRNQAVDATADADGNLAVATVDASDPSAVVFAVTGVDSDIVTIAARINGGALQPVLPGAGGQFTLDLSGVPAGSATVSVVVTDGWGNQANASTLVDVDPDGPPAYQVEIQGESFAIQDTTGTDAASGLTVVRDPSNPEAVTAERPNGLWPNFSGTGYLDMGTQSGDAASFQIQAPADGVYTLTFRYTNGDGTGAARPMTLSVDGAPVTTIPFANTTTFGNWTEVSVDVPVTAGARTFTITNVGANGPNIDRVTVSNNVAPEPEITEPGPREVIKINFQDGTVPKAAGYLVDNFQGYGDRGNGHSYGWVTEASAIDADGTSNTPINGASYPEIAINERTGAPFDGYDPRLTGYAHFNLGSYPAGAGSRVGWEMALENGWYEVTVAVGDTGGPNDSINKLYIEGELSSNYTPTDQYKTELVTKLVHVTDGHLTLSSQGGTLTEIQYLEVRNLPDLTPGDGNEAPQDFATFVDPRAVTQEGSEVFYVSLNPSEGFASGVDPSADLFLGVSVVQGRGGVSLHSLTDGSFRLVETLTGKAVAITANTTAGSDSVTISPVGHLKPFTSYTLIVDGAVDQGPNGDESAPGREFQKLTSTFLTGEVREVEAREVAFNDVVMLNGAADGSYMYTSIEMSPDGKHLYVATLQGEIKRWDIDPSTGGIIKSSLETFTPGGDFVMGGGRRGIVGLTFDPTDPDTIWITDNYPVPLDGRNDNVPDFSGRVSKVTLGANDSLTGATISTYLSGLPRSNGDHVTNSLEFRANPDYNATTNPDAPEYLLYVVQGSNSAMGAPDSAWGMRPERLLNAAILEIDPTRTPPAGGFNVATEPLPADGLNRRFADTDNNLKNGGILITSGEYNGKYLHFDARGVASVRDGALATSALVKEFYDPYADGAVLKIFAEGTRNAYDLVWHSNGYLYVPTNGSAAGGNVPDNPNTAANEGLNNVGLQQDYFFRVEEGGYYGHPNPLRGEFVMNGGNPTAGTDPNQATSAYPVGTLPDPNYRLDSAYGLGFNRSPNGAVEYTSNVFGSSLKGAVLFTEYSGGNDIRAVLLDATGHVVSDFVLRDTDGNVINSYPDPLDVIINPATGQIYLLTLNRSNGQSQLIRLDPVPGGSVGDTTADVGGDLAFTPVNLDDPAAAIFAVTGLDADITSLTVSFDGGATTRSIAPVNGQVTLDLSALGFGTLTAIVRAMDASGNLATISKSFVISEEGGVDLVSLVTIQAEDKTPLDGTAVAIASGGGAQIQIRDASNPETSGNAALVNGLRPGAYGLDGNTNNLDGTPGGYADFGTTNADFLTFTFTVPAGQAGEAVLRFRYANGDSPTGANGGNRPLSVEINGVPAGNAPFAPTPGATTDERLANWGIQEVHVTLVAGTNTVTLRSVNNTGPNVDQLEILVPAAIEPYDYYEAENAQLIGGPVVVPTSTDNRNAEGSGFVDFVGTSTQSIAWTVTVDEAGIYEVGVRYSLAATKAARPATLTVDGGNAQTLPFQGFSNAAENEWRYETVQVQLHAGSNVITLTAPNANGANIDQLRVASAPSAPAFDPDYVEVDGTARIELEQTADHSTRTVSSQSVEFYVKVADSGLYVLDVAANPGAPNGQGLTYFLNGVQVGQTTFPGVGDAGERSVMVELTAGTAYQVRVISTAPGASAIDYLDVRQAPANPNADITIQSLDAGFYSDRLHFSWMDNPNAVATDGSPRDYKENASVRISNSGTEPLQFLDAKLTGPFVLANPAAFQNLVLAAGQSIDVEVLFNRSAYTSGANSANGVFTGELKLTTNDADSPIVSVDLAGFWQQRNEGGWEPSINEVWQMFGFGTRVAGVPNLDSVAGSPLNNQDIYEAVNDLEVLSPYWRLADGVSQAKVTQLVAFHGTGGAAFGIHGPGAVQPQVQISNHGDNQNQSVLPLKADGTFASGTFTNTTIPNAWIGEDVFGIRVAGFSTDPTLNPTGPGTVPAGTQRGHFTRMFVALDENGNVIPNTYLVIQDYTGINYDYNDNMFVISGITPVGTGKALSIAGLDDSAADDRLVFTNIDHPNTSSASNALGGQVFRNETVITLSNPGFVNVNVTGLTLGGPNASAFQIVNAPSTIPAGGSVQVTVRFVGTDPVDDNAAVLYKGTLTVKTDAFGGDKVIQLAGLAQYQSEGGEEPTVAQIVEAFGYSTDMGGAQLNNNAIVETLGDEVLMPYLQRLDGSKPIEIIQIAAFLNQTNIERLSLHDVTSGVNKTQLLANDDQQGQTVLPDGLKVGAGDTGGVARATLDRDAPFGLYVGVDNRPTYISWSDPKANDLDANIGNLFTDGQGHLIRYFQAKDAAGNVIPGTYIGIQDYPGAGNYDYNDMMFIIKNVKPHQLTAAEDANGNGINDALELDTDGDGIVNFFDPNNTPPSAQTPFGGTAPSFAGNTLTVLANTFDEGGQGVAYNDNAGLDGGNTTFRPGRGVEFVGSGNDIGYVKPGEWVEYTINVPKTGVYDLSFLAKTPLTGVTITASLAGGATLGTVTLVDGHAGGSSFDQAAFATSPHGSISLTEGVQTIRFTFGGTPASTNGYLLDLRSFTLVAPADPVSQTPFGGTAPVIGDDPTTILAKNYDEGGQGVAYNDQAGLQGGTNGGRTGSAVEVTTGGAVGWVQNGEWLEYTINVETAGVHTLSFLTATNAGGRGITIGAEKNGVFYTTASGTVANTGSYTNFQPGAAVQMNLEAGVQTIRVTLTGGSLDFQSFTIAGPSIPEPTVQSPFGGTAPSFAGDALTLLANTFDEGGQGLAYNDNAGLDGGNTAFRPGRAVEFVGAGNDIGYVKPGEWLEYTINTPKAGIYDLSVLAKTPLPGVTVTVSLGSGPALGTITLADGHPGGSSFDQAAFANSAAAHVALGAGEQTIRLTFSGTPASSGYLLDLRSLTLVAPQDPPEPTGQTPFGGTAPSFGGTSLTLLANTFDEGGQGVAYNDNAGLDGGSSTFRPGGAVEFVGSGNDIGYVKPGEWLEYTINTPKAGIYDLSVLAKTPLPGVTVTVSLGDGPALGTITLADGHPGGSNFNQAAFAESVAAHLALGAGEQTLRLTFSGTPDSRGYLLDLRSLTLVAPQDPVPDAQTPFGGSVPVIGDEPVSLLARQYDEGGQGIAYNDQAGLQGGTNGGRAGSAVEVTAGGAVGWVQNGEWLEYTINVEHAGQHSLSFLTALGENVANRSITASFALGGTVYETATATTSPTGSWTNFQNGPDVLVDLQAGVQVVRLTFNGGAQDIQSFKLSAEAPDVDPPEGSVIGQSGSVTVAQAHMNKWYYVAFDEPIDDAVVVMGPATTNNKQAATFQIRNVTANGFEYQLDEWDYLDGVHSSETIGWIAMKAGVHTLANGQVVAAGYGTAGAGVSNIAFGETFSSAPVVLAQVAGASTSGAVTDRIGTVGTSGFSVQLQEEQAADGVMPARSLGWIAMSKGGSVGDGIVVGSTGANATHAAKAIGFGGSFDAPLDFIADLQTRNDLDPALVRLNSLTSSGANVFIEEEKSADAEVVHGAEDIGYVAHERGLIFGFDHSLV